MSKLSPNNNNNLTLHLRPGFTPDYVYTYYGDLKKRSRFIRDTNILIRRAEAYLVERAAEYSTSSMSAKLAIVLDIDDTSLSNYFAIKKEGLSNDPSHLNDRYHAKDSPAIKPVLRLYKKALAHQIDIFFITARKPLDPKEDLRPYVMENLQNAGFSGWAGLYMPQGAAFYQPHASFKADVRKMLTEQRGYQIILNIGDQDCDLEGGYAECTVKLPNLLYGAPHARFYRPTAPQQDENSNAITHSQRR